MLAVAMMSPRRGPAMLASHCRPMNNSSGLIAITLRAAAVESSPDRVRPNVERWESRCQTATV